MCVMSNHFGAHLTDERLDTPDAKPFHVLRRTSRDTPNSRHNAVRCSLLLGDRGAHRNLFTGFARIARISARANDADRLVARAQKHYCAVRSICGLAGAVHIQSHCQRSAPASRLILEDLEVIFWLVPRKRIRQVHSSATVGFPAPVLEFHRLRFHLFRQ